MFGKDAREPSHLALDRHAMKLHAISDMLFQSFHSRGKVIVLSCAGDGEVKLHNVWIAERDIPVFARAFLKPEMLCWDDHAVWKDAEHRVHWTLKLRVFTDQVTCGGTNTFTADGDNQTKVVLDGDLDIDLKNIPGVPRILAGGMKPKIEKFIVSLITPNLERVNHSLQEFLDDNG